MTRSSSAAGPTDSRRASVGPVAIAAAATARPGTILQGGRAKAYRPIPEEARRRAFDEGVAAYDRGDFFEAHELLEPAWMGTADPAERDLLQGLIKLAAGYVHGVRGNPLGIARNLTGARERLAGTIDSPAAAASGIDIAALVSAIDDRLARLALDPADATVDAPALPRLG
jgi:predicted metal-dependent hydrolase